MKNRRPITLVGSWSTSNLYANVPLNAVREEKALSDMLLIRKGQRLSIQPVQENEFKRVCEMGGTDFAQL